MAAMASRGSGQRTFLRIAHPGDRGKPRGRRGGRAFHALVTDRAGLQNATIVPSVAPVTAQVALIMPQFATLLSHMRGIPGLVCGDKLPPIVPHRASIVTHVAPIMAQVVTHGRRSPFGLTHKGNASDKGGDQE